jgi:translation initiation factor IF-2
MNKPSKYTSELLHFLENEENYPEMIDWIEDQPELDQPDILREIQAIFKERHLKTGEQDWLDKANFIANGIDDFEEEILDKKLDIALLMMQFDKVELETEKVILFLNEVRIGIIKTILSNPENIKEVKKLARLAIKLEKETGIYDPANWIEIL